MCRELTAEGALNETHTILSRMRELAVQSANDTLTASDRANLSTEFTHLYAEVERIARRAWGGILVAAFGVALLAARRAAGNPAQRRAARRSPRAARLATCCPT